MSNRRLNVLYFVAIPALAAVILTLAWLGVANANVLMPFITGGVSTAPEAQPPWTDPPQHIELFSPVTGAGYHSPIDVTGLSQTFEGHVGITLLDKDGAVLTERTAIGGSSQGFDFFHTYVRFTVSEVQTGTLQVVERSAQDDSIITEVLVPLTLLPGQRFVDLNTPLAGAAFCDLVVIQGYSNSNEANVLVDLRQRDGKLVTQTIAMGGSLGTYADFRTTISHPVTEAQALLVSAYDESADSGDPIDLAQVPISLYPTGSDQCP